MGAIRCRSSGLSPVEAAAADFERALQLARCYPTIFAALVLPLILFHAGSLNLAMRWPHVVAALLTGIYAWWRGGMIPRC